MVHKTDKVSPAKNSWLHAVAIIQLAQCCSVDFAIDVADNCAARLDGSDGLDRSDGTCARRE